jgi:class 3 adenylate cyclase/tetratricopeptide (TPR) repeat protein
MRCPGCSTENPEGAKFCIACVVPLRSRCLKCGTESPPEAKFCAQCGASLDANGPARAEAGSHDSDLTGERRHLTVLFCDLVGSTALAAQLDPEEWRAIVADYHRTVTDAIERFGGHVAQYLGDGVMAYYGYPEAHDNDAELAANAGLAILDAIAKFNERATLRKLSARVGIDSGAVVVGAGAGKEADVFGDAPNIAARVQAAAEADSVMITDATHRLVSGLFIVEGRGTLPLKGIGRPVQLYRVVQPSGARGRLEAAAAARGLSPFVGRDDELRLINSRWDRVLAGEGRVLLIVGEPGIGKSRLVQRFHQQIAPTPHTWVDAAAAPFFQNTPFYPVAEMLRELVGWRGEDSAEQRLSQLAQALELAGLTPGRAIPLIAPLLNLPLPPKYPPLTLAPEQQRRRLLATLVGWVVGVARAQPLVIVIEDLHWADPSTLELIQHLVEQATAARLLLLYTARPEFRAQWSQRAHHAHLVLDRLSNRQARVMVENIASQKELSAETVETVLRRATGVPLFVEELTRDVMERSEPPTQHQIPETLHDSLMARLDRLGSARELAQIGATIGREFSHELLRIVAGVSDPELQVALDRLIGADLLYARGSPPEASYVFKHELVQEAAYGALLKSRRRELHQRIAHTLEQRFPDIARSAPELVAHHCTEAGLIEPAVRYWRRAGRKAIERSANVEAIVQLRKGLELLKALPLTSERLMEEVKLQIALTTPLIATAGYTAPEVEIASSRALELCQQLGETPQLFVALGSLQSIYFNRGELEIALELAKQILHLADTQQDAVLLLWAHYALGFSLAWQGALKSARDHLERSVALYDPRRGGLYGFVQDPGPTAMAQLSHVVHSLGYPQRALERMREAVAEARNLSHPYTLALVLGYAASLHLRRGEKLVAQELWQEEVALCSEQGFKALLASASLRLGFAQVEEGRAEDGLRKMHDALTNLTDSLVIDKPYGLAFMALALGKVGQPDQGLARIDDALTLANKTPQFGDLPLLYLTKGQLLLMKSPSGLRKVKQCFSSAIEIARAQNAKSNELSAAIPLARLLAQQGRRGQARSMLAKIYNWFTEGFDTADLKDAKALLDELGR